MPWKISYYNDAVIRQLLRLPKTLLAKYVKTMYLIEKFGVHLGEPRTKALGNGLFEIRLKGQEGVLCAFFMVQLLEKKLSSYNFLSKRTKNTYKST